MSYELHNTLAGFARWFTGGGWIVLIVAAVILGLIAYLVMNSNR